MNLFKTLASLSVVFSRKERKLNKYSADFRHFLPSRRSQILTPRLNLIIPTISQEKAFGGINTILDFWRQISPLYDNIRIIVFGDHSRTTFRRYSEYRFVSLDKDPIASKQIVTLHNKHGSSLAVGPEDVFIATFWSTAYLAQRIALWQAHEFSRPVKPIVYIIQDFEPAFYPWSSSYVLAQSTYKYSQPTIAVFNTRMLQKYFRKNNYEFTYEFSFEPTLHKVLREKLARLRGTKKRRQILIYGRPSIARNAFSIILEGIRIWQRTFRGAEEWEVISAGEVHRDIEIGGGLVVRSVGKLSIKEYASVLSEAAIGISLMISPHPSYPPLEMAHFGMRVITNTFENKDLSQCHQNITSVGGASDCPMPEEIARKLSDLCEEFGAEPSAGWQSQSRLTNYLSNEQQFAFVGEIGEILRSSHEVGK